MESSRKWPEGYSTKSASWNLREAILSASPSCKFTVRKSTTCSTPPPSTTRPSWWGPVNCRGCGWGGAKTSNLQYKTCSFSSARTRQNCWGTFRPDSKIASMPLTNWTYSLPAATPYSPSGLRASTLQTLPIWERVGLNWWIWRGRSDCLWREQRASWPRRVSI